MDNLDNLSNTHIVRPRQLGKKTSFWFDEAEYFAKRELRDLVSPVIVGGNLRATMALRLASQAFGIVGPNEGNLRPVIEEDNSYMNQVLSEYRLTINPDYLALKPLALALDSRVTLDQTQKPLVPTKTIQDWLPPSLTELGNAKLKLLSEDWYKSEQQKQERLLRWRQCRR